MAKAYCPSCTRTDEKGREVLHELVEMLPYAHKSADRHISVRDLADPKRPRGRWWKFVPHHGPEGALCPRGK